MKPTLSLLMFVVLLTGSARAQANDSNALDRYHAEHLSLRYQLFGGLRLTRSSENVALGFFGGGAEEIFEGSPDALAEMETFTTLRTAGTVLWATGLTILVAELVILLVDDDVFINPASNGGTVKPLFWGLLGTGTALGLAGGFMIQFSSSNLSRAVGHYNDDLHQRLRGQTSSNGVSLRWRAQF
jgi:hypothetical protein